MSQVSPGRRIELIFLYLLLRPNGAHAVKNSQNARVIAPALFSIGMCPAAETRTSFVCGISVAKRSSNGAGSFRGLGPLIQPCGDVSHRIAIERPKEFAGDVADM